MCLHKAIIAVRVDESSIKIYSLPKNDKHEDIRAHYKLNDSSALSRYQTPLEVRPVRGAEKLSDYDLVFDAGSPDWWTEAMSEEALLAGYKLSQDELEGVWTNELRLDFLKNRKGLERLTQTGNLDLSSLTALDKGALPALTQTGYLDLSSLTALDKGALIERIRSRK